MFNSEKIAFAAAAAMHAAANNAAAAAASGGNLADYFWNSPASLVGAGSMPHPLALQSMRSAHAHPILSHFPTPNSSQVPYPHQLSFATNPFFWPKRPLDSSSDSLIGKQLSP